MIGGIDHQADLDLYLEAEELARLPEATIEGVLIKTDKPKRQGIICISVDDLRKNENGYGIGLDDKKYWGVQDGFRIEVFIGTEWYQELQEKGVIGLRSRMRDGSKITIYDRSRLESMSAIRVENLEYYRDNKERLPDNFG